MLDEPTNHLDIDSKEVLENALIDYDGTLVFVSHDRYFINRIATSILELSADGSKLYIGDYDYYIEKKQEEAELLALLAEEQEEQLTDEVAPPVKSTYHASKEKAKLERKLSREITSLEEKLEEIESKIEEIETQLTLPEVFGDHEKVQEYNDDLLTLQDQQDVCMQEWEAKNLELEGLE